MWYSLEDLCMYLPPGQPLESPTTEYICTEYAVDLILSEFFFFFCLSQSWWLAPPESDQGFLVSKFRVPANSLALYLISTDCRRIEP